MTGSPVWPAGIFSVELIAPSSPLQCLTCQDPICFPLGFGIDDRSLQSRKGEGARNYSDLDIVRCYEATQILVTSL